ncbi:TetR/AcrR family transcriptional regulator [Pseudomonas sp. 5Ae-yellow]|uniref:TetR/AcrR family transcriptional regulator n=1 Tax=Pseudomonas sp. 5Ae-yellow TaxID=2759848 RepID=UPI0015F783EB|nr:TetR/AcrR family transcriptional regulator [Pseudomonas sp. 5Ae-yellow]MBA6419802.1 TetR/AcrR family transcriptional regulator [Pseudomonas sp. 5Ae-yellow]|tara:strand:+ start:20254 stop:20859 length:606 start_codon:yes stop_codon:yes gene_type:complete
MNTHSTPEKKPRPRIKDKRQAILDAALKVFAAGGVNGVPMPALAEQAQVGTGTIYRYFSSKEALVNELFREQKRANSIRLYGGLDLTLPAKQLFAAVWQRMADFSRSDPDAYMFMELQDHRPYLDEESRALEKKILRPIVTQYRQLQQQGQFRSDVRPEVLMSLVWGAFVNLIRAERDGHLILQQSDIDAAFAACWTMCTG